MSSKPLSKSHFTGDGSTAPRETLAKQQVPVGLLLSGGACTARGHLNSPVHDASKLKSKLFHLVCRHKDINKANEGNYPFCVHNFFLTV